MSKFKFCFPFQADEKYCKATKFIKFSYEPDFKEGLKIPFPYMEIKEAHCPRCGSDITIGASKVAECDDCGLLILLKETIDKETKKPLGVYIFYSEGSDRENELNMKNKEEEKIIEQRRELNKVTRELYVKAIIQLVMN